MKALVTTAKKIIKAGRGKQFMTLASIGEYFNKEISGTDIA